MYAYVYVCSCVSGTYLYTCIWVQTLFKLATFEGWTPLWADLLLAQYEPPASEPHWSSVYGFFFVYIVISALVQRLQ